MAPDDGSCPPAEAPVAAENPKLLKLDWRSCQFNPWTSRTEPFTTASMLPVEPQGRSSPRPIAVA